MLKKHDRVKEALLKGSIDIGATYSDNLYIDNKTKDDRFVGIHKTEPIPLSAIVCIKTLPEKLQKKIKKTLLNYKSTKKAEVLEDLLGFEDLGDKAYDSVKNASELLKKIQN